MIVMSYVLFAAVHLLDVQCGYVGPNEQSGSGVADVVKKLECPLCSIEAVTAAQQHLDLLSKEEFLCFIGTFDPSCSTNVEYSEFSNEVLFNVLLKHPEYLIQYVADNVQVSATEYILACLATPISDAVPSEQCIKAVSEAEGSSMAKERLIKVLRNIP